MNLASDEPMAIPLWVNGRAFLTVTDAFLDVVNPQTGNALRRVPLSGASEAAEAAAAARGAQPAWAALELPARLAHLAALADVLESYAGHFAQLLCQDTGQAEDAAAAEVKTAVEALRYAVPAGAGGVLALISDAGRPLAALAEALAEALAGGATLVCKPSPRAPSAAFALCELSGLAAWPVGVLNLLQGDEAAIEGLCATQDIDALVYVGAASLGEKVAAIAERHGKPCNRGA